MPIPAQAWQLWREVRDRLFRRASAVPAAGGVRAGLRRRSPTSTTTPPTRVLAHASSPRRRRATQVAIERRRADRLRTDRAGPLRAARRAERSARPVLARRLRRRAVRAVPRRDVRRRDLRRRPLPARHGQGLGSRRRGRAAGARLQLRLQPVVQLRPALGLPALAAGEPLAAADRGGRAHASREPEAGLEPAASTLQESCSAS